MRAKEFIPASKPRNFVAKNQKTAGAGAHRDKKKEQKQGYEKHKGKGVSEGLTTEKQILTRIRQIMHDRKLSDTESNAGELLRLKQQLKDLRSQQGVAEGFMDTIKGAAKELTRDSLQKKIKQAWENTFWPKHIEPALNRIQIDGQPFRKMVLGEPRVIENDRSKNAILKQYTVNIVFPIDPEQWSGDEIRYLEGQLRNIEDGEWNPKVHGLGLVSFDQPMKSFQYTKGKVPDLVIPVRITSLDINKGLVGEQGVSEGDEDPSEEEMDRTVSDLHKDVFGIRPSPEWGQEWMSMSEQEKRNLYYQMVDMLDQQQDMSEGYGNKEFEVDGYTYMTDLDREEDNQKIWHMIKTPDGKTVNVDFTPYSYMSKDDVELYVKLGMPKRPGRGPLDSEQLQKMAQIKGVAMLDPKMARAGM